ncbi:Slp family lipoprotein [Sediminicurvatus halobius]|uniref:Starvation-inducible protein n=1 Tax=Sediminicurvatus halobius TaxID=2182432 RepID=A0A2U2MVT0_9GAMM|nr:Slp family lipoprotein [Spiribacter halobius]PWG60971.1 hypothetical protein DEM34_18900 [Spiribacter halobius]UEX78674.1 Slp family lipoprotein [Spiribacter halobius]
MAPVTRALLAVLAAIALVGCATPPLDASNADRDLQPRDAVLGDGAEGRRVLWGGTVVGVTNEAEETLLEVLGYPLARDQRPDTDRSATGRFLIVEEGFLDPADYAPGREVSVVGPVTGTRDGRVGEHAYTYPVVAAEQLELWPRRRDTPTPPRVRFGVGVIFSN